MDELKLWRLRAELAHRRPDDSRHDELETMPIPQTNGTRACLKFNQDTDFAQFKMDELASCPMFHHMLDAGSKHADDAYFQGMFAGIGLLKGFLEQGASLEQSIAGVEKHASDAIVSSFV